MQKQKKIIYNNSYIFIIVVIICVVFSSFDNFAADSVIVQTFTFDSIITRQARFKFPDPSEKFNKIIAKYRLKCDPITQHDGYDCAEWDYDVYTYLLKPTNDPLFIQRNYPKTTFGDFHIPFDGITKELTTTQQSDKWKNQFVKTEVTGTTANIISFTIGDSLLHFLPNHQFMLLESELSASGLTANSKIGKLLFDANITDTINNLIIRVAKRSKADNFISAYFEGAFDTIAVQTIVLPSECVSGQLTINLNKDFVWDGTSNLIFEIIADVGLNSNNTLTARKISSKRGYSATPTSYAVFGGGDSWIDGVQLPTISGGQQFTFEGWFYLNQSDADSLIGCILFSLGDKFVVRLGNDVNSKNRIFVETMNDGDVLTQSTSDAAISYGKWTHIAVAFNGKGRINRERLNIFVDGINVNMNYSGYGKSNTSYTFSKIDETQSTFAVGRGWYSDTNIAQSNFKGLVAGICVWDIAKNEDQIAASYSGDIDLADSNLVISYDCNATFASRSILNKGETLSEAKVIGNIYFSKKNIGAKSTFRNNFIPNVSFVVGDFTYNTISNVEEEIKPAIPISLVTYKDNAELDYPTIEKVEYYYLPEIKNYDENGNVISTEPTATTTTDITAGSNTVLYKQSQGFKYTPFELGRYITPYGIKLSLGPNGFEWEYDMTDYSHLLRGDVMLSSHNLQELLDLKFIFYKGEPTREVIRISEPWGGTSTSSYESLAKNANKKEVEFEFLPETKSSKIITRMTAHGTPPWATCCEFIKNTHYFFAGTNINNLQEVAEWSIWRECYDNPVYPQGGTWTIQREGWCPGDIVRDYNWDLTKFIGMGKIYLDYAISSDEYDKDANKGNGFYHQTFQVVEYGEAKFKNDLELYKIINPSQQDINARSNPICNGIKLIIRNNSDVVMSSINVNAEVNQLGYSYDFPAIALTKPLQSFAMDTITLFLDNDGFWQAAASVENPIITITCLPIGEDDNPENNSLSEKLVLPDTYSKDNFVIKYKTNRIPSNYTLKLYDFDNKVVKILNAPTENTEYFYNLKDLANGCYRIEVQAGPISDEYFGLYTWIASVLSYQGEGSFNICDSTGKKTLKAFNPDFGRTLNYSFVIGGYTNINEEEKLSLSVFPNPTSNILNIKSYENIQNANINIFDINGQVIYEVTKNISENEIFSIDDSIFPIGAYNIRITNGKQINWNKFIVK